MKTIINKEISMKKTILGLTLLATSIGSFASNQDVDLSLYKDHCVKSYNSSVKTNGQSELNGVYLKYDGLEPIKDVFKSLYFNPDYNANVMLNRDETSKQRTYDLTEEDNVFTFYNKDIEKTGKRKGFKFVIEKENEDTYNLTMFKVSKNLIGKNKIRNSIFDVPYDFSSDNKEVIEKLVLTRDFKMEKSLYPSNTELNNECLK